MQNQFVDLLRKRSRSPLLPNPTDYADPYPMTFDESGLSQPFCDEDLQRIRRWKPLRRRIVVLCSYWLWRKVPQEEWTAWLEEAKAPTPFPPEEFEYLERAEMIPRLAAALGVSRNLLSVDCHRGRSWLLNLKYIQELRAA